MYFFTADLHLGHANIIKFQQRPYDNVDQMDRCLIDNWNKVVSPGDTVWILGDFSFNDQQRYLSQLNGTKCLVLGNHDINKHRGKFNQINEFKRLFNYVCEYTELTIDKQFIVLSHYPFLAWNKSHHRSWQLFGHVHGALIDIPGLLHYDVGVDCNNYTPVSFNQIKSIMSKKKFDPFVQLVPTSQRTENLARS